MGDWITDDTPESTSGKAPAPEIKSDKGEWARTASRFYTPALEMTGMAIGGATGAAAGGMTGPAAPVAVPAGGISGAGLGAVAGRRAAHGLDILFGADKTPSERAEGGYDVGGDIGAFARGAGAEMLGGAGGWVINKLSQLRTPASAATRSAGEILDRAATPVSAEEEALIRKRTEDVGGAMRRTGITALPRSDYSGSMLEASLERVIGREEGSSLLPLLESQRRVAREAVGARVDTAIPTTPQAANLVRKKITAFNADVEARAASREAEINSARQEVVDRINAQRKLNAEKAARREASMSDRELLAAEQQFASDFESKYGQALIPKSDLYTPKQEIGARIQSAAENAEALSQSRFSSDVTGYNQKKFVEVPAAPESNALSDYVANNKPPVGFTPSSDPEMKIVKALGTSGTEEGAAATFPTLDYTTLREISSSAGRAARANEANKPVSYYFRNLKSAAENTIEDMLSNSGGKELVAEYRNLNKLFAEEQVGAFREGTLGNKVLSRGNESGHLETAPGDLTQFFKNEDNVTDLMRGLGVAKLSAPAIDPMTVSAAELATARAATMQTKTAEEILRAGQQEAQSLLRPYYQQVLASKYQAAGGGSKGASVVSGWLKNPENTDVLKQLGLYDEFASIGKSAASLESKLSAQSATGKVSPEIMKAAKFDVVRNTLHIDDPLKVYNYLVGAPNVREAVTDVLRVSTTSEYRSAVKTLVRDGIKADMEKTGLNPFDPTSASTAEKVVASKRMREMLPMVYTKSEISALKDYNTIMNATDPRTIRGFKFDTGIGDTAKQIEENITAVPMGYKGYWVKHGILTTISKLGEKYDAATFKVLEDAMTDPSKADAVVRAFKKGETSKLRKFIQKTYDDDSFRVNILKRIPMSGGVATAAELVRGPRQQTPTSGSWIEQD